MGSRLQFREIWIWVLSQPSVSYKSKIIEYITQDEPSGPNSCDNTVEALGLIWSNPNFQGSWDRSFWECANHFLTYKPHICEKLKDLWSLIIGYYCSDPLPETTVSLTQYRIRVGEGHCRFRERATAVIAYYRVIQPKCDKPDPPYFLNTRPNPKTIWAANSH